MSFQLQRPLFHMNSLHWILLPRDDNKPPTSVCPHRAAGVPRSDFRFFVDSHTSRWPKAVSGLLRAAQRVSRVAKRYATKRLKTTSATYTTDPGSPQARRSLSRGKTGATHTTDPGSPQVSMAISFCYCSATHTTDPGSPQAIWGLVTTAMSATHTTDPGSPQGETC